MVGKDCLASGEFTHLPVNNGSCFVFGFKRDSCVCAVEFLFEFLWNKGDIVVNLSECRECFGAELCCDSDDYWNVWLRSIRHFEVLDVCSAECDFVECEWHVFCEDCVISVAV